MPAWIKPPLAQPGKDDANRRAFGVYVISLAIIPAAVVGLVADFLSGNRLSALPLLAGIALVVIAYILNLRGYSSLASLLLISTLLAVVTRLLLAGRGVHDIAITLYPAIMILVSLLLDYRTSILGYFLLLVSLSIVIFGEVYGFFSPGQFGYHAETADFIILVSILTVIGIGLRLITDNLQSSLTQARQSTLALQESEARFRSLADNAPDSILNINSQGIILYSNRWQMQAEEVLVGRSIYDFVPEDHRDEVRRNIQSVFQDGEPVFFEGQIISSRGGHPWYSFRLGPVWDSGSVASVVVVATSIEERKIAEEALRRSSAKLAALNRIAIAITHLQSLDDVLDDILEQLKATLPLDAFFVALLDDKTQTISYPISIDDGKRWNESEHLLEQDTWLYQVIHTRQPFIQNRTGDEIESLTIEHMIGDQNRLSASILMAPLPYGNEVIGVVSAQSYTLNAYTADDLDFLQSAASQIGIAVQNARLYDALQSELAERRRSESALRQSEARLRAIIENIPYDLWMCDTSGRYIIQSTVSFRMAGNVIGKLPEELNFSPEVKRRWTSLHSRALDGQIVLEEASWAVNGEEHTFLTMLAPVREDELLIGFVGMNVDITDLKRSEDTLRQYAERIEILHQLDQAILAVRSPQEIAMEALNRLPNLINCTSASLSLLDVSSNTAQVVATYAHGKTLPGSGEIESFNDPERLDQLLSGEVVYITDLVTRPLEGPPSLNRLLLTGPIHAVIAVPLRHQDQLVGVLSVGAEKRGQFSQDDVKIISEIATQLGISIHQSQLVTTVQQLNAELEQRVQQRTAQLEAAYKELEAFSYSVSHDLRAPLRGVLGYLSMFMEDYGAGLEAAAQDYLQRVQSSAHRMNVLIDDILALSRVGRQDLRLADFNLHTLCQEVLDEQLVNHDPSRIQVTLHPLPTVTADRSLTRQVMQNLVDNALKYSRSQPASKIEIGSLMDNSVPVFYVKDNGVGLDMKFASRLFNPFQRLHSQEEFEGTGIGLAIVRRILQRHGGKIWVESAPGEGATFFFTLQGD